jgi:hypothetical protein
MALGGACKTWVGTAVEGEGLGDSADFLCSVHLALASATVKRGQNNGW